MPAVKKSTDITLKVESELHARVMEKLDRIEQMYTSAKPERQISEILIALRTERDAVQLHINRVSGLIEKMIDVYQLESETLREN